MSARRFPVTEIASLEAPPLPAKNPFRVFLDDCCLVEKGRWVRGASIYKAYITWCHLNGAGVPMERGSFHYVMLKMFTYNRSRRVDGKQMRSWEGVGLKSHDTVHAPPLLERLEAKIASREEELAELRRHVRLLRESNAQEIVRAAEQALVDWSGGIA